MLLRRFVNLSVLYVTSNFPRRPGSAVRLTPHKPVGVEPEKAALLRQFLFIELMALHIYVCPTGV